MSGRPAPPARFTLRARWRSIGYAWRGIRRVVRTQHNAWVHAAASLAVVAAALALEVSRLEWCALVVAMLGVWVAEAMNTAFEALCDVASPEFHPEVERAKDVAAGAVLLAALGAVAIGLLVFVPHLLARLPHDA
ncbi:MAG TPA: diacylglycerol kinase family protein [Gemmatimonadales bacterium]|nr:diacylglycerol kinase family protein [Gemmatimonadales bacterium]